MKSQDILSRMSVKDCRECHKIKEVILKGPDLGPDSYKSMFYKAQKGTKAKTLKTSL